MSTGDSANLGVVDALNQMDDPAARARALVGLHALMERIAGPDARVYCDIRDFDRDTYDAMPGDGHRDHVHLQGEEYDHDRFWFASKWIAPRMTIATNERPRPGTEWAL